MTRRPLTYLIFIAGSLAVLPARLRAELPPAVTNPPPLFVQRGQAIDITLDGRGLASVSSLALSHPRGLSAGVVETPADTAKPANAAQLHLHIAADAEASLGDRELRLINPGGVSPPLRVTVGQYPQILEKEPNNSAEQAQDLAFPVTLAGKIDPPGDVDCFHFTATKGQSLVFDVHAARTRSQLDALLTIHNQAGHELATKVDLHGGDPVVVFEVPEDGRYLLSIRDLQYRGGGEFVYSIDAGNIPYVQSVLPMSVQAGRISELKPIGVNLSGAGTVPLDLTYASDGPITVRARASAGMSNPVNVDVDELPSWVDAKPEHSAAAAPAVAVPVDVSGRLEAGGDENFYKFKIVRKQVLTIEAVSRAMGSPVEALITLRNAQGAAMQTADESAGAGARISRELDPGDYALSVRDLFFGGGPRYAYRLRIGTAARSAVAGSQDFSLRFLPDALRVSRGGNAVIFFDLQRKGEFKGDVTVIAEDLPQGVTCPPVVINDKLPGASGMLVVSAAPDAPSGSFPIRLRGSAAIGSALVTREGIPLLAGRTVEQAYLTVLDPAPFTMEPIVTLTVERMKQLTAEADALAAKLAANPGGLEAAQAAWEKTVTPSIQWTTLDDAIATSASGTTFKKLEDGSILAGPPLPERDAYTVIANTDLAGITAIRLEMIPDPSLPGNGPGRGGSGNFVLSHFTATIAPGGQPAGAKPVALHHPVALFSQQDYPIIDALEPKPARGWAISPRTGTANEAVFFTAEPIGTPQGSTLTFVLDQQFGQQHTLGRFRLSVCTDAQAALKMAVPANITKLLETPAEQRPPESRAQIAAYYRTVDPRIAADTARLQALRAMLGVPSEIARLEAALAADTPELTAQRDQWEKSLAASAWVAVDFSALKSQAGATLTRQADDSIFVDGKEAPTDVYTLNGVAAAGNITAVRIEALPDSRLPANGPGRSAGGNFVLSKLFVFASSKESPEMAPPVEFRTARATFEQKDFTAQAVLGERPDAGWAVSPNIGMPSAATFYPRNPLGPRGPTELTIVLDHHYSPAPNHALGHFRISVTSAPDPDSALTLPPAIAAYVKLPADKRSEKQKADFAAYYRSIAPSLAPIRSRLAELKTQADSESIGLRGKKFSVPFLFNRPAFAGDVHVTLEGFIAGRNIETAEPTPLAGALKVEPVELAPGQAAGVLSVTIEANSGVGPRYVVLRAEGKAGDEPRVEYSLPFVLTVLEK